MDLSVVRPFSGGCHTLRCRLWGAFSGAACRSLATRRSRASGRILWRPQGGSVVLTNSRLRGGALRWHGARPFFPRDRMRFVETVRDDRRFRIPMLVITFDDGGALIFSRGPYSECTWVVDFDGVCNALISINMAGSAARMPWEPAAAAFLPRFDFAKAPFVVAVERMAREGGVPSISRQFMDEHWREAAAAAGGWTFYSVRIAGRREFGSRKGGRQPVTARPS